MRLCHYFNINFKLEDDMLRKDKDIKTAVEHFLEDDRVTTRGRVLMLCVFGASSTFARDYGACEVHGRKWPAWIRRTIDKYLKNCEGDLADKEKGIFEVDEFDVDIMDEEDWDDY